MTQTEDLDRGGDSSRQRLKGSANGLSISPLLRPQFLLKPLLKGTSSSNELRAFMGAQANQLGLLKNIVFISMKIKLNFLEIIASFKMW